MKRKQFSVLDQYGSQLQEFTGTTIALSDTKLVCLYDQDTAYKTYPQEYLKAVINLPEGGTVVHTGDFIETEEAA